ncbi:MAG: phosphate ABC transporter, permease protein PstA [Lentisphaerae bacterium RIFOXYB12_FULL_65_16]|nr:MAG: phosphate ABC transporter, permease protein PstA [Lentisphaerae bacterium RIFOXYA12_64_32]OGV93409.1 MAG: phosphate ABC transporter, permease protein PstA [Lentisphaerae bacterium RIFOXYB12_FULL_65_16]
MAAILLMVTIMIAVVIQNGVRVFWPAKLALFSLRDNTVVMGEVMQWEKKPDGGGRRVRLKIGNRDLYGLDFRWVDGDAIAATAFPAEALSLERREYGNFYGFLKSVNAPELSGNAPSDLVPRLLADWRRVRTEMKEQDRTQSQINQVNRQVEGVRQHLLRLRYRGVEDDNPRVRELLAEDAELKQRFTRLVDLQNQSVVRLRAVTATFIDAAGTEKTMALADLVRIYRPNDMSLAAKCGFYVAKVGELLTAEPRESNTEGGLFPAIVGTVMMVFLMSIFSFPLGVITAIYLREYAREGLVVQLVRIAVNNLAGIPSIVYGIFGLGFFVYGVGGGLDRVFFPERLPTPTFGSGGILWASLTLALLTVPVVIVATEEALGAIPSGIREGSLALGATKLQTLVRLLVPMASPGILTGFILAMARAAGEVAPLMITGVVKMAPALPLDGQFPFVHLDRKFMHLGFHIYDIGFQSPNVEAAKPMVFITTLLLLLIVLAMSSTAIWLRNQMRKRYTLGSF